MKINVKPFLLMLCCLGAIAAQAEDNRMERCTELLPELEQRVPSAAEYGLMIEECAAFADKFVSVTREIKKLPDKQSRKEAADSYNKSVLEQYVVYSSMLTRLKEAYANGVLSKTQSIEVKKLLSDNDYINRFFTIFRSRYDL